VFGLLLGRGMGLDKFAIHLFAGMVLINYFTETVTSRDALAAEQQGCRRRRCRCPARCSRWRRCWCRCGTRGPMLVILVIACLTAACGARPAHVDPGRWYGMGAALLGFLIVMVLGTAFGLMFSCVNVIFRDFSRIVQTFINMVPFTVPMMYPYWIVAERFPSPTGMRSIPANPMAQAVMLFQRGFWYPTCNPTCSRVDPNSGRWNLVMVPAAVRRPPLITRGFIMLAVSDGLLWWSGSWSSPDLRSAIPERL
jgi:ABC-2 type transport system permease protein